MYRKINSVALRCNNNIICLLKSSFMHAQYAESRNEFACTSREKKESATTIGAHRIRVTRLSRVYIEGKRIAAMKPWNTHGRIPDPRAFRAYHVNRFRVHTYALLFHASHDRARASSLLLLKRGAEDTRNNPIDAISIFLVFRYSW